MISRVRLSILSLCCSALLGCAPESALIKPEAPAPVLTPAAAVAAAAAVSAPATLLPEIPPPTPREFRAAWISTVANIDWPSRAGLPVAQQKAEIETILNRARALNLNAVILQVRPSADAIYPSTLEPWTEYLSGEQGKAPVPFYDPLKTWIDGAHARGLELHAWFNPYRARHSTAHSALARDHFARRNPTAVKTYGKLLWMDPGEPAAARQTLEVMLDVVRRYDVDGVHLDDYFYPYPIPQDVSGGAQDNGLSQAAGRAERDFPDDLSWNRYVAGGGKLTRADWRRDNVNALIEQIYSAVHKEKSWVKVGISPFGLPRPDRRPPSIVGFSQYDKLYADAELWFNNGWLDYFMPQLYWPAAQVGQSFPVLLDYWITQNTKGRALWPGLYTSRIADKTARAIAPEEITSEIDTMRAHADQVGGHAHFSIAPLAQDREGISTALSANQYVLPALVPAMRWLDNTAPAAPLASLHGDANGLGLAVAPADGKAIARFVVWAKCESDWKYLLLSGATADMKIGGDAKCHKPSVVVVTAIDRFGNESKPVRLTAQGN